MKLRLLLLFTSLLGMASSGHLQAQNLEQAQNLVQAQVFFHDKPQAEHYLDRPELMLSDKAIQRRIRQGISLNETDVPLEASYVAAVEAMEGVSVKVSSKWLNAVHVYGSVEAVESLENLQGVREVKIIYGTTEKKSRRGYEAYEPAHPFKKSTLEYGFAYEQIRAIKGDRIHELGHTGEGMSIAVFDAGFPNYKTVFSKAWAEGRIKGGYNFVANSTNLSTGSSHGIAVSGCMLKNDEDRYIGTAPDANYWFFITEDTSDETPLEESNWIAAAEYADSVGVDIINSSLGYFTFKDPGYDYTLDDLNGESSIVSRGAALAVSKGIFVVNSAGNEANTSWGGLVFPADVEGVMSVGSTDLDDGVRSSFSSHGPTADDRLKPDLMAPGGLVYVMSKDNAVYRSSGTSFAAPILCGLAACVWQAYPTLSNKELHRVLRELGEHFDDPEVELGNGLPDFSILEQTVLSVQDKRSGLRYGPNPVNDYLKIESEEALNTVIVYNSHGMRMMDENHGLDVIDMRTLSPGVYVLHLSGDSISESIKIVKR